MTLLEQIARPRAPKAEEVVRRAADWLPNKPHRHDYIEIQHPARHERTTPLRDGLYTRLVFGSEYHVLDEEHSSFPFWVSALRNQGRTAASVSTRFSELKAWWQEETGFSSVGPAQFMLPAYQQIIGLGWPALSRLLTELRDEPDHWFWALSAISGEDPAAGLETFAEARDAWLAWGSERGLLT